MKSNWIFLSYPLKSEYSSYGNGQRILVEKTRKIDKGDNSNYSIINIPSHFGTHIDFPYHFAIEGKKCLDYSAHSFIFEAVQIVEINLLEKNDLIISSNNFQGVKFLNPSSFLIIKTGYCQIRSQPEYWNNNPGFSPELALFLKSKMPSLLAVGFDSISLSSWKNRELGREAHKEFLVNNNLLIIEDMDLNNISKSTKINQIVCSPLRFDNSDGSPVTIFAKTIDEN